MILLWTKSSLIGSKTIRYVLGEPVSHFATVFFIGEDPDVSNGIVLHQKINGGFKITWLPYFLKNYDVVKSLRPVDISYQSSKNILRVMLNEFSGTSYDGGSLLYFSWRAILRRIFSIPLPESGKWGSENDPLCTGHARVLHRVKPEWFSYTPSDLDITTPFSLYKNISASGQLESIVI